MSSKTQEFGNTDSEKNYEFHELGPLNLWSTTKYWHIIQKIFDVCHYLSLDLTLYINRNIITLGDMINEINFPTIAGGFLNNIVIKDRIPKQVFKGIVNMLFFTWKKFMSFVKIHFLFLKYVVSIEFFPLLIFNSTMETTEKILCKT